VAGTGGNEAQAEYNKQALAQPCVCVTTFNMIAHSGKRSEYGKAVSTRMLFLPGFGAFALFLSAVP
jgi:hypothetical protein